MFRDLDQSGWVFKVAGVVQGFEFEVNPVFKAQEIKPEQITLKDQLEERIVERNGHPVRLDDTKYVVKLNTGIVTGYSIAHAVDLIRQNPVGPQVSDTFQP